MGEVELLPCPFCGLKAELYSNSRSLYPHVVCTSEACKACGPAVYSPDAAVAEWNKRAAIATRPAIDLSKLQEYEPAAQKHSGVSKGAVAFMRKKKPTVEGEEYGYFNASDVAALIAGETK